MGSAQTTYQDAKKKEPKITLDDVKEWFKKNVEVKRKQRGFNSFVAPHNNHTYQIDYSLWVKLILKISKNLELD